MTTANKGIIIQGGPYTFNSRYSGGHRIAHFLRTQSQWDVEVLDFAFMWTDEQLEHFIDTRSGPELKWVAISLMFVHWIDKWEKLLGYVKKKNPDAVIIFGAGAPPNFRAPVIDYYIYGFGEHAISALLKYKFSNGDRPRFKLPSTNIIDANDQYPAYPMRSLNVIYEDRDFLSSDESLTLETSRGCKFSCSFCNFPVLGVKGDYTRDADDFQHQLQDAYDRFGITRYHIADETFNDRTEKITKFANAVEQLNFRPWFSGYVRPDLLVSRPLDREELLRMNFTGHYYGVETFYNPAGKIVGKGYDSEKLKQGLIDVKQYFTAHGLYRGSIGLINGLPGEPVESMLNSIQWLRENWIGQHTHLFALEIFSGDFIRKSKMSIDYEKYGYRKVDPNKKIDVDPSYYKKIMAREDDYLDWESDITTRDECIKIADDFLQEHTSDHRWKISNWWINSYSYLPLEEAFTKSMHDSMIDRYSPGAWVEADQIVQRYINNKINWTDLN